MAALDPTNLLLLACALLYLAIGEPGEAAILLVFVVAISLLDGIQQQRSHRALVELARLAVPHVRLRRQGLALSLPPQQLRVGGSVAPGRGGSGGRRRPAHGGHGALAR